jgi:carbonic anhydrase
MTRRITPSFFFMSIITCVVAVADGPKTEWSYSGANGPKNWAKLNPANHDCQYGHQQSPIDIWVRTRSALPHINFTYQNAPLRIIDNGHTIQVNFPSGSWLTVGEEKFELRQLHFHRPAEERVHGKSYDMTVHIVHENPQGKIAVIAVLLKRGKPNPAIQTIWDHLPRIKHEEQVISDVTFNASALLPQSAGYFTYLGSLTTPPCTEDVTWFVMKAPVEISPVQLVAFSRIYPHNARPIQSTGLRTVAESDF